MITNAFHSYCSTRSVRAQSGRFKHKQASDPVQTDIIIEMQCLPGPAKLRSRIGVVLVGSGKACVPAFTVADGNT